MKYTSLLLTLPLLLFATVDEDYQIEEPALMMPVEYLVDEEDYFPLFDLEKEVAEPEYKPKKKVEEQKSTFTPSQERVPERSKAITQLSLPKKKQMAERSKQQRAMQEMEREEQEFARVVSKKRPAAQKKAAGHTPQRRVSTVKKRQGVKRSAVAKQRPRAVDTDQYEE
jgi:hypothetical protein